MNGNLNMTLEQFVDAIVAERQRQMEQYGVHKDHSLDRWMCIIGEEYGKLCYRANVLTSMIDDDMVHGPSQMTATQARIVNQAVQVAACCLALLQESPTLVNPQTGNIPKPAMGEPAAGRTKARSKSAGQAMQHVHGHD